MRCARVLYGICETEFPSTILSIHPYCLVLLLLFLLLMVFPCILEHFSLHSYNYSPTFFYELKEKESEKKNVRSRVYDVVLVVLLFV